jgi:hypothetical protein
MNRVLALLAFAFSVQAGIVQGVVLEHASGRPLARAIVRLEPVPQSGGIQSKTLSTRAGRSGQFVFNGVTPGIYHLVAVRDGYFPAAHAQRLPVGRGTPIQVTAESDLFTELRLRRKGAITGRVLDENGVATAGVPVLAYHARLPLRSAGSGASDDRGVYRIHGLEPGKYWVRSAGHRLDDGTGWLPTFGPQGREVRDARVERVTVDADTTDADINPEPGRLFRIRGVISCATPGPVIVTLSSETGRRNTKAGCPGGYQFDQLAPAVYEVFAEQETGSATGFVELFLDRDFDAANVHVTELPELDIDIRRAGTNSIVDVPVRLSGRRQDMSESGIAKEITGSRVNLAPGHWEFRAQPPAGQFVESVVNQLSRPRRPWKAERADDWFEVFIDPVLRSRIRITVSDQAGRIQGRVMADGQPVPGVTVFLWPAAVEARRSLGGAKESMSDITGQFEFDSLPPGDYRVLASFDLTGIDEELMEWARAPVVRAGASQTATIELSVWVAPW